MTEETQNMPDFANRPQLDKHPNHLTPEVAQKGSALNQNLCQCAQWLKDNKDKAGTDEYAKNFNALESMAKKGYPMAEFEYAKFLMDVGELNKAAIYFDRAVNNENAGVELKKEIQSVTSNVRPNDEEKQNNSDAREKQNLTDKGRNGMTGKLAGLTHKDDSSARATAYKQAQVISKRREQEEGYLPHHSYVPPKEEN